MTTGYIYSRREPASRQQVIELIKSLIGKWSVALYRYQENLGGIELDKVQAQWNDRLEQMPATLWPVGRIFCESFEARWQSTGQQADRYEVQVITETGKPMPAEEWTRQEFTANGEYLTFLWGEKSAEGSKWAETRIPGAFRYPLEPAPGQTMAALRVRDYTLDGIVRLTRLVCVEAVHKPEE